MQQDLTRFLYVRGVERGYSENTTAAYRNDLAQFVEFLRLWPAGPITHPEAITSDVVAGYLADLNGRNYSASTVARKVAAVKSFFHYLAQTGAIAADLAGDLVSPKVRKNSPKLLSRHEVERLLAAPGNGSSAKALRDRALLNFLYATGMRVSEVVALRMTDVDLERGEVRLSGKAGRSGRALPLPASTLQALVDYLQNGRQQMLRQTDDLSLFVNHRGQKLTRQGLWLIIKEYASAAGIADVTPHTLRHSFASHLLSDGTNLKDLQELLGHAHVSTTQIYMTAGR